MCIRDSITAAFFAYIETTIQADGRLLQLWQIMNEGNEQTPSLFSFLQANPAQSQRIASMQGGTPWVSHIAPIQRGNQTNSET